MLVRACPLFSVALLGCSAEQSGGECGESFCLPANVAVISRETPVEDFNLYRVERRGQRFLIYEGNQPQGRRAARAPLPLPLDAAATLAVEDGRGSILVTWRQPWPNFLEVSGPCRSAEQCPAADLARAITRR